jgi:hypothetical protein
LPLNARSFVHLLERVGEVVLVDDVSHPVALGRQVLVVVRADADRAAAPARRSRDRARAAGATLSVLFGQQPHLLEPRIGQDAGGGGVVAGVGGQPSARLASTVSRARSPAGCTPQLVDEAYAASLVTPHVDHDATVLLDASSAASVAARTRT